jgi:hypothetical protein
MAVAHVCAIFRRRLFSAIFMAWPTGNPRSATLGASRLGLRLRLSPPRWLGVSPARGWRATIAKSVRNAPTADFALSLAWRTRRSWTGCRRDSRSARVSSTGVACREAVEHLLHLVGFFELMAALAT